MSSVSFIKEPNPSAEIHCGVCLEPFKVEDDNTLCHEFMNSQNQTQRVHFLHRQCLASIAVASNQPRCPFDRQRIDNIDGKTIPVVQQEERARRLALGEADPERVAIEQRDAEVRRMEGRDLTAEQIGAMADLNNTGPLSDTALGLFALSVMTENRLMFALLMTRIRDIPSHRRDIAFVAAVMTGREAMVRALLPYVSLEALKQGAAQARQKNNPNLANEISTFRRNRIAITCLKIAAAGVTAFMVGKKIYSFMKR